MDKDYYLFILASKRHGAIYIDLTDDLPNCVLDHKCNMVPGITRHYAINQLVYFENCHDRAAAVHRVTSIDQLHRIWKLDLVDQFNPDWKDLYELISIDALQQIRGPLEDLDGTCA
jgi:putative endonuclease